MVFSAVAILCSVSPPVLADVAAQISPVLTTFKTTQEALNVPEGARKSRKGSAEVPPEAPWEPPNSPSQRQVAFTLWSTYTKTRERDKV